MTIAFDGMVPLIQVYDMPTARGFYQGVLGFETVSASPEVDTPEGRFSNWVWLARGPVNLMLNTAYDAGERPPARDPVQERWHRDTGLYFGGVDPDEAYLALTAAGVACDPPADAAYGMRQLWVRDPDGYQLCFQSPVS